MRADTAYVSDHEIVEIHIARVADAKRSGVCFDVKKGRVQEIRLCVELVIGVVCLNLQVPAANKKMRR